VKDLKFGDTIQFGVWKFLETVNGVIKPQFACAQPISIGVRIGENHHTITEVGICGVNLPSISCAGATGTVLMHRAVLIKVNESTIFPESEKFIINDVEFKNPPDYIEASPTILPPFPPPSGYEWKDSIFIKNNSNQDVRLEHRVIPDNQNLEKVFFSENPTVISFDANRNGVCLSAQSSSIISCEGATSKIIFEPAPLFDGVINWTMEFDGDSYELGRVNGNDIIQAIPIDISRKINTDWDGFWLLENKDSVPHRFKLIPTPKPQFDPLQATWSNNQSFMLDEDGSFIFCLAPQADDTCLAEHVTPVVLKNIDYNYKDSDVLCIACKITNLDTNSEVWSFELERELRELKDNEYRYVPNVLALKVPNNISSKYYSLSRYLNDLIRSIGNDIDVEFSEVEIKQDLTVKQTFLGVNKGTSGLAYGTVNTTLLKEIDLVTGEVLSNLGGVFSFTPSDYNDALNQIYGHYKPILEAAGYKVTYYNVDSYFIANRGFQLEKTTSNTIALSIDSTASDSVNVRWDGGWTDWDSNYAYFIETDCIGPMKTEEQFKDEFYLTLKPFDGSDYEPGGMDGLQKRSTRIELMTYANAGKTLPPNGIDWITRNNNGQTIVIDSCYYLIPVPS